MSRLRLETKAFNAVVQRFATHTVPELHLVLMKKVSFQVLSGAVLKTPVDTGRARGGWQLDIGEESSLLSTPVELRRSLSVLADETSKLEGLQFGEKVIIGNNVSYIIYLEEGSSQQAPAGMLAVTLEEVRLQFS